tara:strand:+ start:815 stop:3304 length:2490 start_codon:yes stop_codon:yes gene_type:complete
MARSVALPTITDDSSLGGAVIEKCLRFNGEDGANLTRTPSSAGNRKTWTWSAWIKRGTLGSRQILFSADDNATHATYFMLELQSDDNLRCLAGQETASATCVKETTMVIRDTTSWYHLVFKFDAANTSAVWYVNGQEITVLNSSTNPSNQDFQVNATSQHFLGRFGSSLGTSYFDGYMAEVNFVDGQALGPEYFGFTEFQTGAWKPRGYQGSYGTNGFRLDFLDKTDNQTLGLDKSGRGNHFATDNFSSVHDTLIDTPTNNFCVFNQLNKTNDASVTDGNLIMTQSSNDESVTGTFPIFTGKWYYEVYKKSTENPEIGIDSVYRNLNAKTDDVSNTKVCFRTNGGDQTNGAGSAITLTGSSGGLTGAGVVGIAVDMDNKKIWYSDFSGNWFNSGVPATNTNAAFDFSSVSAADGAVPYFFCGTGGGDSIFVNFGQDPHFGGNQTGNEVGSYTDKNGNGLFKYQPPQHFLALCAKNLPQTVAPEETVPILNPDQHFKTVIYTGDDTEYRKISLKFKPDFLWFKRRNGTQGNVLSDTVRGIEKHLVSNSTDAESSPGYPYVSSVLDDGFLLRGGTNSGGNISGRNMVAWCWKAGGASVTNSDGSVDSQVSANPAAGFSIVTYSGSGNRTIGHGLNRAPEMIIMKGRNVTDQWTVGHRFLNGGSNAWNYGTPLQSTTNIQTNSTFWNNTAPTDTVFSRGSWNAGYNMISYCWHSVEGYSKFGTYNGNGNANGPFVFCGFRPAFVLTKMVDTMGENWTISDSSRSTYNPVDLFLRADENTADTSGAATMDFCATGFKLRNSDDKTNRSGARFIFMAFAEQSPKTQYDAFTNAR